MRMFHPGGGAIAEAELIRNTVARSLRLAIAVSAVSFDRSIYGDSPSVFCPDRSCYAEIAINIDGILPQLRGIATLIAVTSK